MPCVRYWAAARELAGRPAESVPGATLAEVLGAVIAAHGPRMATLLGRSVLLVDGERVDPDADLPVPADSSVEILPPYAGGSA